MNSTTCAPVRTETLDALGPIQLPQPPAATNRAALLAGLENNVGSLHATATFDITTTSCF